MKHPQKNVERQPSNPEIRAVQKRGIPIQTSDGKEMLAMVDEDIYNEYYKGTPSSAVVAMAYQSGREQKKPVADEVRAAGEQRFKGLIKVMEDFLILCPRSKITKYLADVKSEQKFFLAGKGRRIHGRRVSPEESDNLGLMSLREVVRTAYITIFEEKVNLKNLTDEQKRLLANILVMIEILLEKDSEEIELKPELCRVCRDPASARCSRCMAVKYCSTICQTAHWPHHKANCFAPVKDTTEEN